MFYAPACVFIDMPEPIKHADVDSNRHAGLEIKPHVTYCATGARISIRLIKHKSISVQCRRSVISAPPKC